MPDSIDLNISLTFADDFDRQLNQHVRSTLQRNLSNLASELRSTSPKGVTGELRSGWKAEMIGDRIGVLTNGADAAFNRMVGRDAGTPPPVGKLAEWAASKGLNPYAVSKKIGAVGTERFKKNENVLGVDRTTGQPQEGGRLDGFIRKLGDDLGRSPLR